MRQLRLNAFTTVLVLILTLTAFPSQSRGHAFPLRSEPRVGWIIAASPPKVTIWFDGELEPAFSTIAVYNSAKQRIDKDNGRVSPSDATILEVDLPALPSGTYRVYWNVVAKDTHRTEGDFSFIVEGKSP
ncbi:copper resistance protein CopC [bacterium]|nr:MAG: copper resistance protein CopC [bacterium]